MGTWAGPALAALSIGSDIGLMGAWTDNLDLAGPGEPKESGEFWQLTPGLHLEYDSRFEQARLNYEMHAVQFSAGGHEVFHRGRLFSETGFIPSWFYLDLAGERDQSVVTPSTPVGFDALYPLGDVANVTTASVKPVLRHKFRLVRFEASYTRGIAREEGVTTGSDVVPNSNERETNATLSSVDPEGRITWSGTYLRQQVDFDALPQSSSVTLIIPRQQSPLPPVITTETGYLPYRYEQASGELGLRVTSSIRLLGRGGKESDPFSGVNAGGLGATFWAGGFDWTPDRLNEFRFLAGRRFYGTSYEALWRRRTRLLNLQVTYTEQPTTEESIIQGAPLTPLSLVYVPGTPAFSRLTPDVFLQKSLYGAATLTGRLTAIGLSVGSDQRTYITITSLAPSVIPPGAADRDRSATLYATRRLGPLTDLRVSATLEKEDLREGPQYGFTARRYSAQLSRRLSQHTSLRLGAYHLEQSGGIQQYKANVVTLNLDASFGAPAPGTQGATGSANQSGGYPTTPTTYPGAFPGTYP